jgi:hypothetical protein
MLLLVFSSKAHPTRKAGSWAGLSAKRLSLSVKALE